MSKRALVAAFAASLAACAANPKTVTPTTDVVDGASAAPVADATPQVGACRVDADCGSGERCDGGACSATVKSGCDLVRVGFAFDSAQLSADAMSALRDDARCIGDRGAASLLIEGHCDERGTAQYNVALGARRAEAVRKYLADLGVKAKLETVSFGKELPLVQGTGEAAWAKNRRAELRLPGDTRSDGLAFAGR